MRTPTLPLLALAAFAGTAAAQPRPNGIQSIPAPNPDPRVGLRAGWWDAGEAIWNLKKISTTKPSADFTNASTPGDSRLTNSDLAFTGNLVFQGNYSGWQVWDIGNPAAPKLATSFVCPGSQSDVTVYKNLLFVSAEALTGRVDCGLQGVEDTVSTARARGIRIFDITDIAHPKSIKIVQTCRGSHTNTLATDPKDPANVYIYVSGSATVRSASEMAGCSGASLAEDPNSTLFRIEVIKVPVAHPEQAAIVSSPRIFQNLAAPPRHGETMADSLAADSARRARAAASPGAPERRPGGPQARTGPNQCHDITVYPAIGLAGGACGGYGLLLDVSDVAHPKRINAVADSNFSFWHSATFSNDGKKVLFSDEWGGGRGARCRVTDKPEWGADAIFTLDKSGKMEFQNYYKLPAPQTSYENCVAHNGTLIPIPGREVMVQSWYQGGISVFDWTDPKHPKEIAFFDRGPMDSTKLVNAGYWSSYWYNGYIVGSEISRGLDIFELAPSPFLSQNEIDAAKSVKFDHFNAQEQPKLVWPASFSLSRAYLDQLERDGGMAAARVASVRQELTRAEGLSGAARRDALTKLSTTLHGEATKAADAPKAHALATSIGDLAKAAS